jgi:hypothetical protein
MLGCMSLLPFLYYTLVKRASERKKSLVSHATQRNESTRIHDGQPRGDAAKRRRKLAGWIADGSRGEGFGPVPFVEPGPAEVKRARLVFSYTRPVAELSV